MKKGFLILFLSLIAALNTHAESEIKVIGDSVAINLAKSGDLPRTITKTEVSEIKRMSIKGALNSVDLRFLSDNEDLIKSLTVLNLQDVTLDIDEGTYTSITSPGDCSFYTYTFHLSNKDKKVHNRTESSIIGWSYYYYDFYSNDLGGVFAKHNIKTLILPKNLKTVGAYMGGAKLETVVLPEGITKVKECALSGASNLTNFVNLDKAKLTEIEASAFSGTRLKKIDCSNVTKIGDGAFKGTDITYIDLSKLDTIPYGAFGYCENLSNVKFGNKLTYIGAYAFANCALKNVAISNNLTYVAGSSFDGTDFANNQISSNGIAYLNNFAFKIKPLSNVATIKVREGATHISDNAAERVSSCSNLTITLPSTLKYIGDNAFKDMPYLTKCDITNNVEYIGNYAFHGSGLKEVTLPASITHIGYECFNESKSLLKVSLNYTGKAHVESRMFAQCKNLIEANIGAEVKQIPALTFRECTLLTDVIFAKRNPQTSLYIGDGAFYKCSSLQSIELPEATDSIDEQAFAGSGIRSFRIPTGIKYLGNAILSGSGKDTLYIPNITADCYIGSYPMQNSTFRKIIYKVKTMNEGGLLANLSTDTLFIGKDVESLPGFLLSDSEIKRIVYENRPDNKPLHINDNAMSYVKMDYLYVPEFISYFDGVLAKADTIEYRMKNSDCTFQWIGSIKQIIIGKEVERVPDKFVRDHKTLESIIFERRDKTTPLTIGESAFKNCEKLQDIELPEGISELGESSFAGTKWEELNIPATITSIGKYAFGSTIINKLTFAKRSPTMPLTIGDGAFYSAQLPDSIAIPEEVEEIAPYTFDGSNLRYVYLPSKISKIGSKAFGTNIEQVEFAERKSSSAQRKSSTPLKLAEEAFANTAKLDRTNLPDVIEELPMHVFANSGIRSINIGANVKSIGEEAFMGCSNLRNLTFSKRNGKQLTIGKKSFYQATLDSLIIPEGTTEIGEYTFQEADIKYVKFPSSLRKIDNRAFIGCKGLKSLTLPRIEEMGVLVFSESSLEKVVIYGCNSEYAIFYDCPNLKTAYLMKGCGNVMFHFQKCKLDTIVNCNETPAGLYSTENEHYGLQGKKTLLYVLPQSVELYKNHDVWGRCTVLPMSDEQIALGISSPVADDNTDQAFEYGNDADVYAVDGTKKTTLTKGLNIVRNKHGKTKKIFVP